VVGPLRTSVHTDGTAPADRSILTADSVLLVLLFLASPILTTTFRLVLPALPEKEFVAIGVSGLVFGGYLLVSRNLVVGLVAALLVLVTVLINVPLGPSSSLVAGVGPHLWLVHVPFLGLIAYYLWKRRTPNPTTVHLTFAGLITWSLLAALVGNGPRPDVAVFLHCSFSKPASYSSSRRGSPSTGWSRSEPRYYCSVSPSSGTP